MNMPKPRKPRKLVDLRRAKVERVMVVHGLSMGRNERLHMELVRAKLMRQGLSRNEAGKLAWDIMDWVTRIRRREE
jgi:hypothetical protein